MEGSETIGAKLKRLRERRGISKSRLARLSGVSRRYIIQIEKGEVQSITLDKARALAEGLGVSPEIFLSSPDSEGLYYSQQIFHGFIKELKSQGFDFDKLK